MAGFFTWMATGAGVLAAYFWYVASRVDIPHPERFVDEAGDLVTDPFATMAESSRLNVWAAGVTASAIFFQAVAQAIPAACTCIPNVPTH